MRTTRGPGSGETVQAGPVIFGDPGTRFTELVGLLLETIARIRPSG